MQFLLKLAKVIFLFIKKFLLFLSHVRQDHFKAGDLLLKLIVLLLQLFLLIFLVFFFRKLVDLPISLHFLEISVRNMVFGVKFSFLNHFGLFLKL